MSFTHTSSSNELWLSLRFPQLSLDLLQQTESQGQNQLLDQPTVIAKNSKVYLACDKAHALGISPGTSIHTALLLCEPNCDPSGEGQLNADPVGISKTNPTRTNPSKINPAHSQTSLLIRPYSEEKNHNALQQLAQQAYEFTPYVSLWETQQSLLLELSSCLSLFGGLENLLEKIRRQLQARAINTVASLAHTPRASWLLGWYPQGNLLDRDWQLTSSIESNAKEVFLGHLQKITLAELPELSPFSEKLLRQLHNIGLKTLGELFALPRNSISRRYGQECLKQLDQIRGTAPDLQAYIEPAERFFAERHYLSGLETSAMVQQPVNELLLEFQQFLKRHQFQAESFHWRFFHFDKSHSTIHVELSSGHTWASIFEELTLLQLAKHQIQSPIETVALHSDSLSRIALHNKPLFAECGNHSAGIAEAGTLYDTLKSRMGQQAIYQLQACNEHLPEYRQSLIQPLSRSPRSQTQVTSTALDKYLPLWLLPMAQPLSQNRRKRMTLLSSAHRIDSHWWQRRQQRDYFVAEDIEGRHWVYFDHTQKRWFIQGHYG